MIKVISLLLATLALSGNALGKDFFAAEPEDIDCLNRFKAGINFLYGITIESNPRVGLKLLRDASECGDKRAKAFVSTYQENGGVIEPWKGN